MLPRELTSAVEIDRVVGDDSLLAWVAQGARPDVRAWTLGAALAIACPDLARRDRLAVRGPADEASAAVRHALAAVGPSFRLIGDAALIRDVVARDEAIEFIAEFGWMETREILAPGRVRPESALAPAATFEVAWLAAERLGDVAVLLDEAFPHSNAHPSRPGVRRWAGAFDARGDLVATAADAWPAPTVGFISGVATRPGDRGRGAGEAVCRFVIEALVTEHGRAALMVNLDNEPALALYRRLGLRWRAIAGARVRRG